MSDLVVYIPTIIQMEPPLPPPLRLLPSPPSASILPSAIIMAPTVILAFPPPRPPAVPLLPLPPWLPVKFGSYREPYADPPYVELLVAEI